MEDWVEGLRCSLSHALTAAVLQESEALLSACRAQEAVDLVCVALSALGDEESVLRRAVDARSAAGHRTEAEGLLSRLAAMPRPEPRKAVR